MKQLVLTSIFLFAGATFIFAQQADTTWNNPDEKITVNKEYDENGNLIRFDSTYVFEWHGDSLIGVPREQGFFRPPGFMGMEDLFQEFFGDTSSAGPFGHSWRIDPFKMDSLLFDLPDIFDLGSQFQLHGFFHDENQQKDWDRLMKKHQEEIEKFQRKWNPGHKKSPDTGIQLQKL